MHPSFWASSHLYSSLPRGCARRIMRRTMRLLLSLIGKHPLILGKVDSTLECIRELGWMCFICLSKMYVPLSLCPVLDLCQGQATRGPYPSISGWVWSVEKPSGDCKERRDEVVIIPDSRPGVTVAAVTAWGKVTAPVTFLPSVFFPSSPSSFLNIWVLSRLSSLS